MAAAVENKDVDKEAARKKAELEALRAEVDLDTLLEAKRRIEERKCDQARAKNGKDRVMVYALYDGYFLGRSAARKKKVFNDKGERVLEDDPDRPHAHYDFPRHRCWVFKADLPALRHKEFYGREFIEAIAQNDGDKNAQSLEEMLVESPAGEAWLKQCVRNDHNRNIKPGISEFELRAEIIGLRNGTVKPPPLPPMAESW